MLFTQNKITATVSSVLYTEDESVVVTVDFDNQSQYDLTVYGNTAMTGSVNGWAVRFVSPDMTSKSTTGSTNSNIILTAQIDERMQIKEIQSIYIAYSAYANRSFEPKCALITNPDCPADYVQEYAAPGEPIYENKQLRFYDYGVDEENQIAYVFAECLVKQHSIGVVPYVNGFAYSNTYNTDFTANGQHAILQVPLAPTMDEYGLTAIDFVGMCVKPYTNGTTFYGKSYSVPLGGKEWPTAAPAYEAEGEPIIDAKGIQRYRTKTDAGSYFTSYTMVCVNNTENILWVYPDSMAVNGERVDAYSYGTVPAFSVGTTEIMAFSNISTGAEVNIAFLLMDVRANFRNIVVEKVTFTS